MRAETTSTDVEDRGTLSGTWAAWPPQPGQLLDGRYSLCERVGKGGMGVVFRAEDVRLSRLVAVKFVRVDRADDPEYVRRLHKEARFCARIAHENVARILDVSPEGASTPYLVFEFVEGQTVAELLEEKGRLGQEEAVRIASEVCEGLTAAHAAGVVHRDLKPANIIVYERADGTRGSKIVDFGIARAEARPDESEITATTTDSAGGTPHYMAPEVIRGESSGDERADVYALGAILFELLAGAKPHQGLSRNAVLYHAATSPTPQLFELVQDVSRELAAVVHDALASRPDQRIPNVRTLADRLRACVPMTSSASISIAGPSPGSQACGRRTPTPFIVSTAVALMLGILLGSLVLRSAPNQVVSGTKSARPSDQEAEAHIETPEGTLPSSANRVDDEAVFSPFSGRQEALPNEGDDIDDTLGLPIRLQPSQLGKTPAPSPPPRPTSQTEPELESTPQPSPLWQFETENPYE